MGQAHGTPIHIVVGRELQNRFAPHMAPQVSDGMRERILAWHDDGKSPQEISELAGCSLRMVYYILSYRDYGTTKNPFARKSSCPQSLDTGDVNYLVSLIMARPKIYLDELQEELLVTLGLDVSIATISWVLRQWEMSNKGVASATLERNELLHAVWQAEYGDIPAEYCVWLDEASVDDKTNQCEKGWSPIGQACVCFETFIQGQQFSVLPALASAGIIALDIFEGAVNKECFVQFINEQVVRAHHFIFLL